jgi:hypothetical protein
MNCFTFAQGFRVSEDLSVNFRVDFFIPGYPYSIEVRCAC